MGTRRAALTTGGVLCGILLAACGGSDFPVSPSPTVQTPVVTLQGTKNRGNAIQSDGSTVPFNMTLIARALAITSPGAQPLTPGTTEVTGSFEAANGLKGTVAGTLEGTLENGNFLGTLSLGGGCSRQYGGPISASGLAWTPIGALPANCALTFSLQLFREGIAPCSIGVSASSTFVSGNGGSVNVAVTAPAECPWAIDSVASFVHVTGSASGTGNGNVTLTVDANAEAARQGTLRIGGQALTIAQGAACTYSIAPESASVAGAGGNGSTTVTAPAGCEWTAQSLAEWLSVSPAGGAGGGSVTITAQPNSGSPRQGSARVAGRTFTVNQAAGEPGPSACNLTIGVTPSSFTPGTGNGTLNVSTTAGCAWTIQIDVPWIRLTTAASGTGPGQVGFLVLPNSGPARTAPIRVNGETLTVSQAEEPDQRSCVYELSSTSLNISAAGGSASLTVTTTDQCKWSAQTFTEFASVSGAAGFTGTGTATFVVQPNPTQTSRQGRVVVAAKDVTLTQSGPTGTVNVRLQGTGSGQVSSAPAGLTCSGTTCTGTFAVGTQVTLTSTAASGSRFDNWSGLCAGSGACTVDVRVGTNDVGATFTAVGTIAVRLLGQGTVSSNPIGLTCSGTSCTGIFPLGTVVTLTPVPGGNSAFATWSNPCPIQGATCVLTVSAGPTTIDASFVSVGNLVVQIQTKGTAGGNVTSEIDLPGFQEINCDREGTAAQTGICTVMMLPVGTRVTLFAGYYLDTTPPSTFDSWSGCMPDPDRLTCTLTIVAGTNVVQALFVPYTGETAIAGIGIRRK